MHHLLTDEDRRFRDEIAETLRAEIPQTLRDKMRRDIELEREDFVESQRILNRLGLAVPHWPAEWGGRDWTPIQRHLYLEQMQVNAVPPPLPFNVDMVGPVLARFGTDAQKEKFLKPTANLDIWWCQGFSEPNAGSDLASLVTRAERRGDGWVLNGQKTWTSYAHHADWMFGLFRTDPQAPKKQMGISFLVFPMDTPGIEVREIETSDGRHEVNEVFFSDVEVGADALVGEENRGWDVAKFLLGNERHNIAGLGWVKMRLNLLRELAERDGPTGRLWDDPEFRRRFAQLEVDTRAVDMLQMLALTGQAAGAFGAPDHAASVLKIRGSELQQATTELLLDALGPVGGPELADAAAGYMSFRKLSIYGGSNEIQREILAKAALGL
ncbi:acyl-CoA dehydrogenase [Mesobaculum littorinae]|uniref:Acyl-CoA dehydrogenase n=1 Tax=Mesobaculum littorinae TaxID=2486419 RepID=A0A438AHH9_9RHOB|nr:acyl-CoA dehydrogenase family protein [Mesobaculum littorinae]RVV98124.1 acyl-CoA dehydrogenase [Mesobaculum littorinae]